MKLNTRILALAAAIGAVVTGASAQTFVFGINGTPVAGGSTIQVLPGQAFTLQIWADFSDVTATRSASSGGLFVGLSRMTTGTGTHASAAAAGISTKVDGRITNLASALPAAGGGTTALGFQPTSGLENFYTGLFGTGQTERWAGVAAAVIFPTGNDNRFLPNGGLHKLADFEMTNTLAAGESQFIGLATALNATSRSNLFVWNGSPTYRTPAQDYRVNIEAVPEPGTMIALGAGIAALAARRRRKA